MGELRIMDRNKGDLKVIWDKDKPEEIKAAKKQFNKMLKNGYLAYSVKKDGSQNKQMTEFDEKAEKVILSPVLVGG